VLYAIAQIHVALGDCTQAITFYRRFLSTHPARMAADAAREAIDVCEHAPPAAVSTDPGASAGSGSDTGTGPASGAGVDPGTASAPASEPGSDAASGAEPGSGATSAGSATVDPGAGELGVTMPAPRRSRAWYRDPVGVSLVGGGVVLGVAASVTYVLARNDLDEAETAPTYAGYLELADRGNDRRLMGGVLAGAGVAATAAGVYRLWRHSRAPDVALVPTRDGGVVSWAGSF
jgi:hypothetical protein